MGLAVPAQAQVGQREVLVSPSPVSPEAAARAETTPGMGSAFGTEPVSGGQSLPTGAESASLPRRTFSIVPRITVAETLTDNVAPASGAKRSDQITEISPGIRINSDGGRVKLHFDYHLRELLYAQESGRRNTQNYLNAFGTVEAVEKWLFVDASGVVNQQQVSPFGFQSASNTNLDPNRVETSSFRVSPYVRGKLAGEADYEVRYSRTATRHSSALATEVDTEEWSAGIKGDTALARVGWGLDASHQNVDYSGGRKNEADRLRALLSYQFDPEFRLSVSAGQESNNYESAGKQSHDIYGYGFDWLPSLRTRVSAFREKRFFGHGHTVSISHRTPLTALQFSDVRDVSVLPNRLATVGLGTIYDLLFLQLSSAIPDAVERARFVDTQLQQLGISPDLVVTGGFLTARVSTQRRQELSFALHGARNVLTLAAARSEHDGLGTGTDIFTTSGTVRQRGFSISLAHRLTPQSTLNTVASRQNSSGSSASSLATELQSLHISVASRLGPRTTASLGARRALFDSTNLSYSENALLGSISLRF